MFSYIYMKILESSPDRYDRAIRLLSFGSIISVRRSLAERAAAAGRRVLDLGTGTGELALLLVDRGAAVTGIDVSAPMLKTAQKKKEGHPHGDLLELKHLSVAEMDSLQGPFDAVVSSLVFSELSEDEQNYALKQSRRLLTNEGVLAIADEALPPTALRRFFFRLLRLPLLLFTLLIAGATTRPVGGLENRVRQAGFEIESCRRRNILKSMMIIFAKKTATK